MLEITFLTKFAFNQAGQGRALLECIKGRSGEITGGQIACSWLAELLITASEIENVVNDLEGQTQLAAEAIKIIELGPWQTGKYASSPSAICN